MNECAGEKNAQAQTEHCMHREREREREGKGGRERQREERKRLHLLDAPALGSLPTSVSLEQSE